MNTRINTYLYFVLISFFSIQSFSMTTEIGLSYSYQKKNFNSTNYYQTETKTASVTFYLFEKVALELSYTDSFYENQEKDANSSRVLQQTSIITGGDLIYIFTDQRDAFQPYVKGGTAYITKKAIIKYENADAFTIPTKNGFAPSYGVGLKYKITETLSVNVGYSVWQTPMDDGSKTDDSAFKTGLSWYL